MIYKVQIPTGKVGEWKTTFEYDNYDDAKKKCIEIVGEDDYYAEPFEETDLIIPPLPFEWNGYTYENKETGEKRDSKYITLFKLSEGYFGKKQSDTWDCRIYVVKDKNV